MATLLYTEGWLIVALALAAAFACWRNAHRIGNMKRVIRQAKVIICLLIAAFLALGLLRIIPSVTALALLLAAFAGLLLSLTAREIVESPTQGRSRPRANPGIENDH